MPLPIILRGALALGSVLLKKELKSKAKSTAKRNATQAANKAKAKELGLGKKTRKQVTEERKK